MTATCPIPYRLTYSFDWLCQRMQSGQEVNITETSTGEVHKGRIIRITKEDGSGNNWIITLTNKCQNKNVFVRTA